MSTQSHFQKDIQSEQILGSFLDDLYMQLGINFQRISDKEKQNQGIDIIVVNRKGKQLFVDEKAQLDYIGQSLKTFAFEIGFFKHQDHKKGWLYDGKKLTSHYMLITDICLKNMPTLTKKEDIESVKLLWINREKLLRFLADEGLDQSRCEQEEKAARATGLQGRIYIEGKKGLYFYLSDNKAEAPFNLVIARYHLLKIGAEIFPIT